MTGWTLSWRRLGARILIATALTLLLTACDVPNLPASPPVAGPVVEKALKAYKQQRQCVHAHFEEHGIARGPGTETLIDEAAVQAGCAVDAVEEQLPPALRRPAAPKQEPEG